MNLENIKTGNKLLDKDEILSNADKAFERMTNVLLELKPPETRYTSQSEKSFFNELKAFVKSENENIKAIKHHLKVNVEWEQLNVAFFGETNAGKSTTIESILSYFSAPTNGQTIGNGSKDFTREVTYHTFKNKGNKIGLIDLPGIEGDEKGNLHDIDSILKKGITKAHIVFYVYGNSKKPEPATVKKINKYLDDQAAVISICNNRGKAGKYKRILNKEGKVELQATEINKQSKEILKEELGKQYKGDLFINSLAAYLSVGKIEREDFETDKSAFLEVFKNDKELMSFSNLKEIINTIEKNSETVDAIILDANKQKLNHVLKEVVNNLNSFKEKELPKIKIKTTNEEIREFFKVVKVEIRKSHIECKNSILTKIDIHFKNLQDEIFTLIEKGDVKEEVVKRIIEKNVNKLQIAIKKSQKEYNQSCIVRIEQRLKQLKRYSKVNINLVFSNSKLSNNIDLDGLKELDVSFGDVAGFAAALGGFIFGPWGGAISLAGWAGAKLLGDGGKAKSKDKISEALRIERNKLKEKFRNQIIKNQYNLLEKEVFDRLKQMQEIPHEMLMWREKINKSAQEIKNLIIK